MTHTALIGLFMVLGCEASSESQPVAPPKDEVGVQAPEPEPEPQSEAARMIERVMAIETFENAVAFVQPYMADTRNDDSVGATLLALWAQSNLRWSDVQVAEDETTIKLTRKDPDAARGKRFCYSGRLVQIEKKSKSSQLPMWVGLLSTRRRDIIRFYAAGSSGDLVDGSKARFCGVVTGLFSYDNAGGGTTHAVSAVGMFKLPDNINTKT